jgi:hypothetical protein
MGSWRRAVEHQVLLAVRERERVAVDGDLPDDRVPEGFRQRRRGLHIVPLPEPGDRASMVTGAIVPVDGGAGA